MPRKSVELDEQGLNAFVVARGLMERGTLGLDGTAPSAIAAVILYDVAVETAAKATLRLSVPSGFPGGGYFIKDAKRSEQRKEYLPWILDQLLASYRERKAEDQADWPALREARNLHDYRNTVQHQGTVPSPQDVDRQRFRADDFISSLARSFFGRQLAELSRAMLVHDKEVRTAIQAAEQGLADGDLIAAVEQLSIAFELAREAFRSDQPHQPFEHRSVSRHEVRRVIRDIENGLRKSSGRPNLIGGFGKLAEILQTLVRRSERAEDRLEALSLGAQASDYVWFRNRFPRAQGYIGSDSWSVVWTEDPSDVRMTREEVIRGLDFVTTVALHWQQFPPAPDPEADEKE
jgi:hypothetical protein